MALPGGITGGRLIVCPYHQWSYDLNGALVAAPHLGAGTGFDKSGISSLPRRGGDLGRLRVLESESRRGAAARRPARGNCRSACSAIQLDQLRIGATIEYEVAANWKIICENYNECYHCGGVHPELCAVVPSFREAGGANLDWSRGVPHREGAYTFTHSGTTSRRAFPGLDADEQGAPQGRTRLPEPVT